MATTGCTTVYQWQGIVQGMLVALLAEQKFFRTFGVDQQIFEHDVFIFLLTTSGQQPHVPYVR